MRQKQKHLKKEVEQQQQQLSALDKKIDQMIAYEVEQARKRAEAARKKAEAEARRKAEKQRKQGRNQAASGKKEEKKSLPTHDKKVRSEISFQTSPHSL